MTLLLEALGSIARWLLAGLMGYFVAHGVFTQTQADNYTTALAGAVAAGAVSLGWSLWQKYSKHLQVLTALSMPAGSSVKQLQSKINTGMGARLGAIVLACALGAGAVSLTGCAGNKPPIISQTQAQKAIAAIQRAGGIVLGAQAAEEALFAAGDIPAPVHADIEKGFAVASQSALTAIDTLEKSAGADPQVTLKAVTDAIQTLTAMFGHLTPKQSAQLSAVLDAALAALALTS